MRVWKIVGVLLLITGVEAFVFSCFEVKYKLIDTDFQVSARYACLVAGKEFIEDRKSMPYIYAEADGVSTSFDDLLDATCIERPGDGPWRIKSNMTEIDDLNLACDYYTNQFTLLFTSTYPDISVPEYDVEAMRTINARDEAVFVFPNIGIYLRPQPCTGNGNVTVFTGVGTGVEENRFLMKSWRCGDIPDLIVAMDNVITVAVDEGVELTTMYESKDANWHFDLSTTDRHIAVMASGRSDNLMMYSRVYNYVAFESKLHPPQLIHVSATCSPCYFDPNYGRYAEILPFNNQDVYTAGVPQDFYNETSTTTAFDDDIFVQFMHDDVDAKDIGESEDYFVIELTLSVDAPQTSPVPSVPTDASKATSPRHTTPRPTTPKTIDDNGIYDPYCGCSLDAKFGMPEGWDSTDIWIDLVIILDTSEAMGEVALVDASTLIESLIGTEDVDVLTTDTSAKFYTRIGLVAMSDKAEVIYNLNMTKHDKVTDKVQIKKGVTQINVVDAFNAALVMFDDGLKSNPDRVNTRQVIYYMTDSDPKTDLSPLNQFKTSLGIIIVNNFLEAGDVERPGLKDLASEGYYRSDIQDNYMESIQLFCKANCYCSPDLKWTPYAGQNTDPAVKASGGCYHAAPVGVQFSKAKSNCDNLGGGLIASIHDEKKAEFVNQLMVKAAPKSDYFWIGYSKADEGWIWEDQSSNPYTNWDHDEPSASTVAKCAYVDMTSPGLYWGAGNCNVGFPSVCQFAPCSVGNKC